MNGKIVLALALVCILLFDVANADCGKCNTRLRQCKRPCRTYDSPLRRHECKLPCYRRAVYCLNTCERKRVFSINDLNSEDAVDAV